MPRVRGYRRSNGTRVRAHNRRGPAQGLRLPPTNVALGFLSLLIILWLITVLVAFTRAHPVLFALLVALFVGLSVVGYLTYRRAQTRQQAIAADIARHIEVTDRMTGTQFEHWVAAVLTASGFTQVQRRGGSADRGADITAVAPDGRRTVVQCKRYGATSSVGSAAIQQFAGTCRAVHQGELCLIITNGRFTAGDGARLAQELDIRLVDRTQLAGWAYTRIPPSVVRD